MKKPIIRALIVGVLFVFVYYAYQILHGVYQTMNYVPDIVEAYESVDHLQIKVAFGYQLNPLRTMIEIVAILLLGMGVYYSGRMLRRKKLR
jgi:Cytochrome b subunit of the bc complex